jgi:single-strand DNA-binding protein
MSDTNTVVLIGRLVRDADLKYTSNGKAVTKFSLAVNEKRKEGDVWKDYANFFDVTLWGQIGESIITYLIKGKQISVVGKLTQERWQQDGQTRSKVAITATTIQLLSVDSQADKTPNTSTISQRDQYLKFPVSLHSVSNILNRNGFYKGIYPRPLFTEKVTTRGYTLVKVSMTGPKSKMWKEKHRLIWEKAYGEIPKGHIIIFLDGNHQNFALKNLAMLSKAEIAQLNQLGLLFENREATFAGIAIAKYKLAVHRHLRDILG